MQSGMRNLNIEGLDKVYFLLDNKEWHGYSSESLWAKNVENNHYLVMNVPFYLKGLSLYDIISVENKEDRLYFKSLIKMGDHSTYRIILNNTTSEDIFEKYWKPLEEKGCTYEKAKNSFYAIDVPPFADIYKVYNLLENGERNSIWEFEEGNCEHTLKNIS